MSNKISHLDGSGNPIIVDIGTKQVTRRSAVARAVVAFPAEVWALLDKDDWQSDKKGGIFQTAIIAGIMGAKKTGELIPLCHPIGLDHCTVNISVGENNEVFVWCKAEVEAKTGVEMEALTGASVAALTIYDMCKALSHDIIIREVCLMAKSGGKRNFSRNE